MTFTTRAQNLGLALLAAITVALTAYAVWSVGDTPSATHLGQPLTGAAPAGDADAATATVAATPTTTGDTTADVVDSTAPPATSVSGWLNVWSGDDADLLVIGDGYSNLRSHWIHQWAVGLAQERPVQIHHWAEAEDVSFNEPDVLSEGTGPGVTIWNASRADTTIAEAAEHVDAFRDAAGGQVDAALVSLGRGSAGEDVAASLDALMDELDTDLPVLVLTGPPGLYSTGVTDSIVAWAEDHQDRVALLDLGASAPDGATADEWAEAFESALAAP